MRINNKKDFLSGFFLLVLGIFYASLSLRLSIWSSFGPQEGFFPLLIAALVIGLSIFVISRSLVLTPRQPDEPEEQGISIHRVGFYTLLIVLYAVWLDRIGFLITSGFFLILILKFIERQSWKVTMGIGAVSIMISYLLFVHFLGVPLPKGLLNW